VTPYSLVEGYQHLEQPSASTFRAEELAAQRQTLWTPEMEECDETHFKFSFSSFKHFHSS
jgi:hypothetical protein